MFNWISSFSPATWSAIAALTSSVTSVLTYTYTRKKDFMFLIPRLIQHDFNYTVPFQSKDDDYSELSYDLYNSDTLHLTLSNVSPTKIFNLDIDVEVIKNDSYKKLINYTNEGKTRYFKLEQDISGKWNYGFRGVFGVTFKSNMHQNIFNSEQEINVTLPSCIWMLIEGYNIYMSEVVEEVKPDVETGKGMEKVKNKSIMPLKLKANISYTHSLTKKDVNFNTDIILNFKYSIWGNTSIYISAKELPQK